MPRTPLLNPKLLETLQQRTTQVDLEGIWPVEQLADCVRLGTSRWSIPAEWGGVEATSEAGLQQYVELSQACMTSAFIQTQRNSACHRIAASENDALKRKLLPALASGHTFTTVGISHLTTSRQHLKRPAVTAEIIGSAIRLNGTIPWVTGAAHVEHLVTGGTLNDGRQLLVALPMNLPGIQVHQPENLMALRASETASVAVKDVVIPADMLIAGPVKAVINSLPASGTGSLTTSALAIGLSLRTMNYLEQEAATRDNLQEIARQFREESERLETDFYHAAAEKLPLPPDCSSTALRQRANSLVMRITQAALGVAKGTGFVKGHPIELAVREAMFFLVWSCPQPVVQGALEELACRTPTLL